MRVRAILNRDGGSLKSLDVAAFAERLRLAFESAGEEIDVEIVPGERLVERLEAAAADERVDALVVGGGDGTVSTAAAHAWRGGKILGVLPAGTMNLFARSLGLPLDLDEALTALADGDVVLCDIGTANGVPFVHQYSVGVQPSVLRERGAFQYQSRIGKMWASLRAAWRIFARAPSIAARIERDGAAESGRYSFIAVSNNPYGEGHMPYADRLDGGTLGLYRAGRLSLWQHVRLALELLFGAWRGSPHLEGDLGRRIELSFRSGAGARKASLDGELIELEPHVALEIHPGAFKAIVPSDRGVEGRSA